MQAFAHDLRKLREKAGDPTYRILARKAGYSPATLSEAARGQRRPSLDVTLAYVGACGGDLDEWRLRWQALVAAKAGPPVATTADAAPGPSADVVVPDEPAPPRPSPPRSRRWKRPLVLAVALVLAVVVTDVVVLARPWASDKTRPGGCPRPGAAAGAFSGQTYTFTRVRDAAALSARVVRTVPAGCTVTFSGYCLGDVVTDETSGTPDIRWFILTGGGLMASGVVHGNPPPRLGPSSCPGSIAPPATIHLTVHRIGGQLQLQATGEGTRIVGFTSLDPGDPADADDPRWHQIHSMIASHTSVFETSWQPDPTADTSAADESITVAAVACLGGDGPTTAIDAEKIQRSGPPHITPTSLSGAALDAATRSACQYPNT